MERAGWSALALKKYTDQSITAIGQRVREEPVTQTDWKDISWAADDQASPTEAHPLS